MSGFSPTAIFDEPEPTTTRPIPTISPPTRPDPEEDDEVTDGDSESTTTTPATGPPRRPQTDDPRTSATLPPADRETTPTPTSTPDSPQPENNEPEQGSDDNTEPPVRGTDFIDETITRPDSSPAPTPSLDNSEADNNSLPTDDDGSASKGLIVGGIVAGVVAVVVLVGAFWWIKRRKRRHAAPASAFDAADFRRSAMLLHDPPTHADILAQGYGSSTNNSNSYSDSLKAPGPRPPSMFSRRIASPAPTFGTQYGFAPPASPVMAYAQDTTSPVSYGISGQTYPAPYGAGAQYGQNAAPYAPSAGYNSNGNAAPYPPNAAPYAPSANAPYTQNGNAPYSPNTPYSPNARLVPGQGQGGYSPMPSPYSTTFSDSGSMNGSLHTGAPGNVAMFAGSGGMSTGANNSNGFAGNGLPAGGFANNGFAASPHTSYASHTSSARSSAFAQNDQVVDLERNTSAGVYAEVERQGLGISTHSSVDAQAQGPPAYVSRPSSPASLGASPFADGAPMPSPHDRNSYPDDRKSYPDEKDTQLMTIPSNDTMQHLDFPAPPTQHDYNTQHSRVGSTPPVLPEISIGVSRDSYGFPSPMTGAPPSPLAVGPSPLSGGSDVKGASAQEGVAAQKGAKRPDTVYDEGDLYGGI